MSRYGLEIRSASAADAAGLAELLAGARRSIAADVLGRRLTALATAPACVLLALEWGPPTGVIVAHWLPTLEADARVAQLSTLLVASAERRRGVGRALLKSVSQAARQAGCDTLRVVTGPEDMPLEAFCRATGFEREGGYLVRPLRKRG